MKANLYFAIKMCGYGTLYSSEYLERNNRKIDLDKDFLNSEFNEIFGDRNFKFPVGLNLVGV
jgi:hypothetical protein